MVSKLSLSLWFIACASGDGDSEINEKKTFVPDYFFSLSIFKDATAFIYIYMPHFVNSRN
jgi:hypothetical protein